MPITIVPKLAKSLTARGALLCFCSLASLAYAQKPADSAADSHELEVRHGLDDIIEFKTHPGKAEMMWEVVRQDQLIYLNYSRFPWGQDPTVWGLDPAQACYDHVNGKNYVGIGDSLPHLKRAMKKAIEIDGGKMNCMICGPYETSDSWSGGMILPDLSSGVPLPVCAVNSPTS